MAAICDPRHVMGTWDEDDQGRALLSLREIGDRGKAGDFLNPLAGVEVGCFGTPAGCQRNDQQDHSQPRDTNCETLFHGFLLWIVMNYGVEIMK